MEIVGVINNQSSQNRELWYELVIIENKSTEIANLGNKWLFGSRDRSSVHPSNLTCTLRSSQKDEDDIIFENIDILPGEKFYIYSGNDAKTQLTLYGGKGIVATTKFIWSDKGETLTLATMDGNVIHSYSYGDNRRNIFEESSTNLSTLFE